MGPKIEGRDDSYYDFNKFPNWELEVQMLTLKKKNFKKISNLRSCTLFCFLALPSPSPPKAVGLKEEQMKEHFCTCGRMHVLCSS